MITYIFCRGIVLAIADDSLQAESSLSKKKVLYFILVSQNGGK